MSVCSEGMLISNTRYYLDMKRNTKKPLIGKRGVEESCFQNENVAQIIVSKLLKSFYNEIVTILEV